MGLTLDPVLLYWTEVPLNFPTDEKMAGLHFRRPWAKVPLLHGKVACHTSYGMRLVSQALICPRPYRVLLTLAKFLKSPYFSHSYFWQYYYPPYTLLGSFSQMRIFMNIFYKIIIISQHINLRENLYLWCYHHSHCQSSGWSHWHWISLPSRTGNSWPGIWASP